MKKDQTNIDKGVEQTRMDSKTDQKTKVIRPEHPFAKHQNRILVGFLVSFSAHEAGQFWLLKEGNNTIGSSPDANIKLNDETVTQQHALLNIRIDRKTNRFRYTLKDENSTNGTFVNGEDIVMEPYICQHFDKIQIGDYTLLLVKVDKNEHDMIYNPELFEQLNNDDLSDPWAFLK